MNRNPSPVQGCLFFAGAYIAGFITMGLFVILFSHISFH